MTDILLTELRSWTLSLNLIVFEPTGSYVLASGLNWTGYILFFHNKSMDNMFYEPIIYLYVYVTFLTFSHLILAFNH